MYLEILVRILFRHKFHLVGLRTDFARHPNRLTAEAVRFIQPQNQAHFAVYLFGEAQIACHRDPLTLVGFITNRGEVSCLTDGWGLFFSAATCGEHNDQSEGNRATLSHDEPPELNFPTWLKSILIKLPVAIMGNVESK